jgi:mannose-6-phosphate isomerase-like protein (cupin superfamily)
MEKKTNQRSPVILAPGAGRNYPMGPISALFKADGAETAGTYSISKWWLDPNTQGPGAHSHPEDDVFYVIEGTMSFLVGKQWLNAPPPRAHSCWYPAASRTSAINAGALILILPRHSSARRPGKHPRPPRPFDFPTAPWLRRPPYRAAHSPKGSGITSGN